MDAIKPKTVDSYIEKVPEEIRGTIIKLRRVIKKSAPKAKERISYGVPFYEYGGSGYKGRLIYFAAFKKHISVFIPPSLGGVPRALQKYQTAKSTFRFPIEEPPPFALIGKTVKVLVKERDKRNKSK